MSNDEGNKSSIPQDPGTGLEGRLNQSSEVDSSDSRDPPSPPLKRRCRESTSAQIRQLQQQVNTLVELVTSANQQSTFQEQQPQDQSLGGSQTWLKTPEQPDQRQPRQKKDSQTSFRNSFNSSKSSHYPRVRSESRFQTPRSKDTRKETAKPVKSSSFRKKPTQ
ncbi:hypothetical protein KQX54_014578 [Cotesia glomerata]|uniref:Uncharacterized protein n=1 Tax=Cotesia glomerata TaxID=32391 RepID=A0AAV7I7E0_COTGL|nr:hypothetical protein KQX54_014578 [Cotesia glomerata]